MLRHKFDEWSKSLAQRSHRPAVRERIASVMRGVGKPQPAPLVYVGELTADSGPVLYEHFTPSARELASGHVLLDAQHQGGSRWMFYNTPPFALPVADRVPKGALVIPTDDPLAPQLVEENFKPTQEQLESGKYWLDSDNGKHRWYRMEHPEGLFGE